MKKFDVNSVLPYIFFLEDYKLCICTPDDIICSDDNKEYCQEQCQIIWLTDFDETKNVLIPVQYFYTVDEGKRIVVRIDDKQVGVFGDNEVISYFISEEDANRFCEGFNFYKNDVEGLKTSIEKIQDTMIDFADNNCTDVFDGLVNKVLYKRYKKCLNNLLGYVSDFCKCHPVWGDLIKQAIFEF